MLYTLAFWKGALERATKIFAEALGAFLIAHACHLFNADWYSALAVAGMAALLSVLNSIASSPLSPVGSASLVNDRPPPPQ